MNPLLPPQLDHIDRLLLAAVRVSEQPLPTMALDEDWESLLARAHAHRVLPLVLTALESLPSPALPEKIRTQCHRLRRGWTAWSLLQEGELSRAAEALAGQDIRCLVLKGEALGRLAYAHRSMRGSADLDLLVPLNRYPAALQALEGAGFALRDRGQADLYHHPFHYHDILVGRRGLILELHWGLTRADDLFHLDPDSFLEHGVRLDAQVPLLWTSPTDLLLHSASQSLAEGFASLKRIADADGLVRRCGARIDRTRLVEEARRGGLAPSLWLLLTLAGRLLGTSVQDLCRPLRPGPMVRTGLASLSPANSLASGFAQAHTSLRALYTAWLVCGTGHRCKALLRTVRLQNLKRAGRHQDGHTRLVRRLLSLAKLLGFQLLQLLLLPFRRPSPS